MLLQYSSNPLIHLAMKKSILLFLCFVVLFSVSAEDRHVYLGQSIQTAVNAAVSGDKVIIHVGTYNESINVLNKSNITITSAGDGTVVVQGNGTNDETIYVLNPNNIVISNLTIKNIRKQIWVKGIYVDGAGSGIQILNNIITEVSYKSGTWSASDNPGAVTTNNSNPLVIVGSSLSSPLTNVLVSGNVVSYCTTGWSESITVKANVDGFKINNNIVHHVTNIAMDAYGLGDWPNAAQVRNGEFVGNTVYNAISNYADNGGIYVDGGKDILIANNTIYNSVFGITIGCENQGKVAGGTTSGIKVINNRVYNNAQAGIMIGTGGDEDGLQGDVINCTITGNTFLKNSTSDQWGGELVLQNCSNITLYNNIFFGSYQQMVGEGLGVGSKTLGYNIFYNLVGTPLIGQAVNNWNTISFTTWKSQNGDVSSLNVNPLLVNASSISPDVHLGASSPAINAGKPDFSPLNEEVDIDGQSRIQNSRVDIGIDESGSGSTVAVTGVSVTPINATIVVGQTQQLTRTISPTNATNQNVTWGSNNTSVATVNSSGTVSAIAVGSAMITATTADGGFIANSSIAVTAATVLATSITVSPTSVSLLAGQTQQLTATILPTNATNTNVIWSSSNTAVAAVSATGIVSAFSAGVAVVTVTTQDGGLTATSTVTVNTSDTSWTLINSENFETGWGIWVDGGANAFRYTGGSAYAHQGVAALNIQANTNTSVVTTTSLNLAAYNEVKVDFWFKAISMENGEDFWLQISNNGGASFTTIGSWKQGTDFGNDTFVSKSVTISSMLLTSATKIRFRCDASNSADDIYIDEVVISARGASGIIGTTGVIVSPTSTTINVGSTSQLTATVLPSNATNQNVTWSSSNASIATVNTSGIVSAVGVGSATINATTQNGGFMASATILVTSTSGTTITINGSLSDWSGINAIATATNQSALSMKVYDDGTYLYFGISGSALGPNYQVLINTDNNTSTGFQHSSFTSSGADYYIENGNVGIYTGTGTSWSWNNVGTAIASKNSTVCELRVAKSLLGSLGNQITLGYADINSSWAVVSKLGFSAYSLQNGGRLLSPDAEISIGESLDQEVNIYPNPYSEVIHVDLGNNNKETIIIINDTSGRILFSTVTSKDHLTIPAAQIGLNGLGILTIQKQDKVYRYKIGCH